MQKVRNYFKVLIWPFFFTLITLLVNFIFVSIFNSKIDMSQKELIKYIETTEYKDSLNNYINSKSLLIILIITIFFLPLLYRVFKKHKTKNNFRIKDVFIPILFGISISLIYNISLYGLNNLINFTDMFKPSKLSILVQIICSGICGPILEELIFRGIVYNRLKEFNKPMKSIILTCIIFGLFHGSAIDAIYAFGVSFIFIFLYEKYKTLTAPIIMHIVLNTTIILMLNLIIKDYLLFNLYLLIISIIILLFLRKFIKKDV